MLGYENKITSAEAYAERFLSDWSVDSVFIGGSLTAGLGSPTSDVDLFVLTEDKADSSQRTWQAVMENTRIDIEVYSIREFEGALHDVLSTDFNRREIASIWDLKSKMDLIARFENSVVVKQSERLDGAKQKLEADKDRFYVLLANYWSLVVEAIKEDFIGSVLAEDYQTAAYLGQNLLSVAGKSFVSACGDSYFGEKWVYQQLKRSCLNQDVFKRFFSLQTGGWIGDGRRGATEVLYMAQSLVMAAQTMNALGGQEAFNPNVFFIPLGCQTEGLLRNPLYGAFKVGEKVQVHWEMHKDVVLSGRLLCLMGIAHMRCLHDVCDLIKGRDDLAEIIGGINEDAVAGMIDRLEMKGLLLSAPSDISTLIRL